MTATENLETLLGQIPAALDAYEAEKKREVGAADAARDPVRIKALKLGVTAQPSWPDPPDETAEFASLRSKATALTEQFPRTEATVNAKVTFINNDRDFFRAETLELEAASSAPRLSLVVSDKPRQFKGKAAELAAQLDAHLDAGDRELDSIRHVPKDWKPTDPWPPQHVVRNRKRNFGANTVQRGVMSGYGMVNYFHFMLTGDPRCLAIAESHLRAALAGLIVQGGVNTTETDFWLGIPYGSSDGAGLVAANTYTALEAMLLGGFGAHARSLWENRNPAFIVLINQYRAFFWKHHVPRWVAEFGADWSAAEPTYERKNFAHSNLNSAANLVQLATIETEMFKLGMTKPVTTDLPDGFDGTTKRKTRAFTKDAAGKLVWGEGDGRTVSLAAGTTADRRTHPLYRQACAIFKQFTSPLTFRIAYGDDIKDPAMRALYAKTGCAYWDQRTNRRGFTANSGYNQMSDAALEVLKQEGVIADVLGSEAKAEAFMAAVAGGVSVGMLPERFVSQGKTAYVFDDPASEAVSNAYLVNGRDVRAFGGGTVGNETDDSPEWEAELYGIQAPYDPADRLAKKSEELLAHAVGKWDKDPADLIGGAVCRLYNEVKRGRA